MIITVIVALLVVIVVTLTIIRLHEKQTNAMCKSKKKLEGRVAVVTGGTAGMGLEIATDLARRGAKVIIACPFEQEGVNARRTIIESTGSQKVIFKLLDLKSLESVREFTADILNTEKRLDILINNAGVAFSANTKTYIGTNFMMAVNYLGHFILTLLLLPLLKKSGTSAEPSRIVNVSSVLHLFGRANYESYNRMAIFYRFFHYCHSKFCVMLFTHELSKRLKDSEVVVNAVDPGAVGTNIYQSLSKVIGLVVTFLFKNMFKTPWEGAQTALYVALDDETRNISGQYFKNCKLSRAKKSAYDDKLSKKLWNDSIRLVKLEEDELKICGL
ncbi:retinol dehydrogenase 11-like [Pectinophora gossypiella]|uniref:retinol dehydrogenase 11-like n=1 Tax=Pectinophora gossypiella TaxID=13191 RepID=UPI00214E6F22|nr:retinol dehydrogenase 11-like [Pectinophora gossypiella]